MTFRLLLAIALAALLATACSDGDSDDASTPPEATASSASPADAATPTEADTAAAPPSAIDAPFDHDIERAMEHVRVLSVAIGPRVSGSQEARQTVAYIADVFRSYGYAVEVMEFDYKTRFRAATVTVNGETIEGVALNGLATPPKSAEGRAVEVGARRSASFSGSIPVRNRNNPGYGDVLAYMEADRNEATGLVIVNQARWPFYGFPIEAADAIPVVLVSHTEADRLTLAVEDGATITVSIGPGRPMAANVIARPAEGASCNILAGGHHDTVAAAPGAIDNASGVAIVLELARAFAVDGLDEGLCFATFGAEESGLFGSAALARGWEESGELPEVMVNFDVTARGEAVELIGSGRLVGQAVQLLSDAGIPSFPSALPQGYGSDHQSFVDVGVPVLYFSDGDVSLIHTPGDVIAEVEPVAVDRIGDAAALVLSVLLAEIAGGP
ncbi:MAG: M28 family metallopeptidase [Chloroflexi bacterium]|nr:M28 family metallopeptidase [Chloroflexota bacterium]